MFRDQTETTFDKLLNFRWVVLILSLILIGVTAFSIPKLTRDTTADAFIDKASPALIYKNRIEDVFGLTDPVVIAVIDRDEDGIFDPSNLALVQSLTDAVKQLPQIDPDKVVSLATENYIVGTNDGIIAEGFLDRDTEFFKAPTPTMERAIEVHDAIDNFPLYQGSLVGRTGTATLIIAEILDEKDAQATYDAVLAIVADTSIPEGSEVHVAGEGAVAGYLSAYIDHDAKRLNPMAGLIITVVLIVAFLSVRAAIVPNIIVAATVLGSFGLMAASATPFFVITNGLVVNLIGIAVADSIHVLSAYYGHLRERPSATNRQAASAAMSAMWRPITLTTVTTIVGFLALAASSNMPPVRAFGLFGALGVGLAWIYSMTLLPTILSLWPVHRVSSPFSRRKNGVIRNNFTERMLLSLGRSVLSAPKTVIGLAGLLFVIGVFGAGQVVVDEARIENFKPTELVYQADQAINAETDGIYNLDILVEAASIEGLYDPALLKRIEAMQVYMETLPHVSGTNSIVDYIKQLNRAANENDPAYYAIPDDANLVAQLLFLYGASADPTDFDEEVDYDYRQALIRARVDEGRYTTSKKIVPALEDYAETVFNRPDAKATITGRTTVNFYWIEGIDRSTLFSVILSFCAVTLVAMLIFRSVTAGLLAAMPVGFAVLLVYAVMGFAKISLGVSTAMFAAIAIGLSIDFAIHALDKLREIGRDIGLNRQALLKFYKETGRALFFNFIAVSCGFGVLMTSSVPPLVKFGCLVAVAVTVAFIASMTLLPALVTILKPRTFLTSTTTEKSYAQNK